MKTKEEFNLSEKIKNKIIIQDEPNGMATAKCNHLIVEDVKKFIRLLKEEMKDKSGSYSEVTRLEKIDTLAGEKLK